MKKTLATIAAIVMMQAMLTACDNAAAPVSTEAPTEAVTAVDTQNAETVLIKINTEGWGGQIAYTDDGSQPIFNDEYPAQSAFTNTPKGTTLILSARNDPNIPEDVSFAGWKKDGADFSTDPTITVTADADCEYIAVFLSGGGEAVYVDLDAVTTLGEVLDLSDWGSSCMEGTYVQVFEQDGTYYRAIADIDEATSQAFFDLSYDDVDYDQKRRDILAPLTIRKIENISAAIPPQEELDKLIGKTGGELLDDGWVSFSFDPTSMESYMQHGLFAYTVVFEGEVQPVNEYTDDTIKPLTVKSVTYEGLGDASDLHNSVD